MREERDESQETLARRSGISAGSLARIELGQASPAWATVRQIARALNVLTLRGEEVSDVTAFIARSAEPRDRAVFERYPDEPVDSAKVGAVFERFGLPAQLG